MRRVFLPTRKSEFRYIIYFLERRIAGANPPVIRGGTTLYFQAEGEEKDSNRCYQTNPLLG